MREEGKVLSVGRKAEVIDRMVAVENLSDRILHLAHSLAWQPAHDGQRRSVRSKVRSLHIFDLWFRSTVVREGPRQVTRRAESMQSFAEISATANSPSRRHCQQASVFDAEGMSSDEHSLPTV